MCQVYTITGQQNYSEKKLETWAKFAWPIKRIIKIRDLDQVIFSLQQK